MVVSFPALAALRLAVAVVPLNPLGLPCSDAAAEAWRTIEEIDRRDEWTCEDAAASNAAWAIINAEGANGRCGHCNHPMGGEVPRHFIGERGEYPLHRRCIAAASALDAA
jgi:hypothetical protein